MRPQSRTRCRLRDHGTCLLLAALSLFGGLTACDQKQDFTRAIPTYRAEVMNASLSDGLVLTDSGVMLAWGSDGTILRSTDASKWQQANSPSTSDLQRGATDGKTVVIVGNEGEILRSDDTGDTWHRGVISPATNASLHAVAYVGAKAWIAVGAQGIILRSLDGAKTWSSQQSDKPLKLQSLFFDATGGKLYLGGDNGLLGISSDGGDNWTLLHLPIEAPLVGFHRFGNTLIARSAFGKLLSSQDQGQSWQLHQLDTKGFFTDSTYDPQHQCIVATTHLGEVARSCDQARHWSLIRTEFAKRSNYLSAIRFDETHQRLVAVGHHGTVLYSVNGGLSWQAAVLPGAGASYSSLIYDATRKTMVLPGNGGHLLASTSAGENWFSVSSRFDEYQREVLASLDGHHVITVGDVGSIYLADADAARWQVPPVTYPDPATPPAYRSLLHSPSGNAVLAGGPPGTIMRSSDQGQTWMTVLATPLEKGEAIVQLLSDTRGKTVISLDAFGAIKTSDDDGLSWSSHKIELDGREIWHGALGKHGSIVAVGRGGLIVRAEPGGKRWSIRDSGVSIDLYGSACTTANGHCFAVGKNGSILRSTDDGQSWRVVHQGGEHALRRLLADPRSTALLAYGEGGLILRSTDGGSTWATSSSGVSSELRASAIEPGTGQILLAGASGSLLRSGDGGVSWRPIPTHTRRHFRNLGFNPGNGVLTLVGERTVRLSPAPAYAAP